MSREERPGFTFRSRVLRASAWTGASYVLSQAIRFGSNLITTRLLVPEMFGVMAIAGLVFYGLSLLTDVGIGPNIVQSKRGNEPAFLDTAWVLQIRRGIAISLFSLLAGLSLHLASRLGVFPPDSVYLDPQLPYVIAALSIGALIGSFESTKLFEAARNMETHRLTMIELASQALGLVVMLVIAIYFHTIWALVAGNIVSSVTRTALSHVVLPGHGNRWQWDDSSFREIVRFGKWIFLSSIFGFLVNSGDRILLGGMLTASALGVYSIAYLLINAIESVLTKLMNDVSFPALSEIARDRPTEIVRHYYRFHYVIASFAFFVGGFLATAGQALIHVLYDRRYEQAAPIIEILAVGLIAIPFRLATQCFQALGSSRKLSEIIAIRVVCLYLLTPVAFHYFGLYGALWSIVFSNFAGVPLTIFYASIYRLFDWRKELTLLLMVPLGMLAGRLLAVLAGHWT